MLKTSVSYQSTGRFSDIFLDYLSGDEKLLPFYKFRPTLNSFAPAIAERERIQTDRQSLCEAITQQYNREAPEWSPVVEPLIGLLKQENTFTVTTGHQLNLFTGPLYSLFKIATTIRLAGDLKKRYPSQRFVPVFWMATEDHDFEEINHLHLENRKISWEPGFPAMACGRMSLKDIKKLIDEVRTLTGDSPLVNVFAEACEMSTDLAQATRRWIHRLFSNHELLVIDGDDSLLKKMFAGEMIEDALHHSPFRKVSETAAQLEKHYKVQVTPREINLFYLGDDFRSRIVQESSGRYAVLDTAISFTSTELENAIRNSPERFSPNVVLRPVYQEKILPNLAYVGGPGELAYWLELRALFENLGVPFPIFIPRNSFTVVETQVSRKMAKAGIQVTDIFMDREKLLNTTLKGSQSISTAISNASEKIRQTFMEMKQPVISIDPTLEGSLEAEKQKVLKGLAGFEEKLLRALKKKEETTVNQVDWILDRLFPGGTLQERHQNIMALARDTGFIDEIISHSEPFAGTFDILVEEQSASKL